MSMKTLLQELHRKARNQNLTIDCPMDGQFNAEIAIVGEAPGTQETVSKAPFSGGAGRMLWHELGKNGITRNTVYCTNAIKRQLALSQITSSKSQITKAETTYWTEILQWELSQLPNLKHILCLGNAACLAVMGLGGITNLRGHPNVVHLPDASSGGLRALQVLPTYNPAAILRSNSLTPIFSFDLRKFKTLVTNGLSVEHFQAHTNPSTQEALRWIDKMQSEQLPVSLDIETIGGETACVGLGNSTQEAMCINFRDARRNRYSVHEERQIRMRLHRFLSNTNTRLVMQNGAYDSTWLAFKDGLFAYRVWFDTLLAHHTLAPTLPHNLGFLTSQYTNLPYYKDERHKWSEDGDIESFWEYNVKDVCVTLIAQQKMQKELINFGLHDFFHNHVMRAHPHLCRMTTQGCPVDVSLKSALAERLCRDVDQHRKEFNDAARASMAIHAPDVEFTDINPNSPLQLKKLFFTHLRLHGKNTSTNEENREAILNNTNTTPDKAAVIHAVNKYSKEYKFYSTYANMRIDADNRVRCEYKQFGVQSAPGRLSSSSTGWGTGMNMQNQPERAQSMYIAPDGYAFLYFDLSQAEARVVGWLAGIQKWVEDFETARTKGGFDCHRALAADMFEMDYADVPEYDRDERGNPSIRFIAKRCRHGLNYRMFITTLAATTGLSMKVADQAYYRYHSVNPEIKQWWDYIEREIRANKSLWNCFGRRMVYLTAIDDDSLKSSVAFKPQSTIGDKVVQVIYQCHEDDDWPHDARMVFNIHDALIAMVPHNKVMRCARIMKRYAETPIDYLAAVANYEPEYRRLRSLDLPELIIPADFKVSYPTSWAEKDGQITFAEDARGNHRWSHMKKLEVQ